MVNGRPFMRLERLRFALFAMFALTIGGCGDAAPTPADDFDRTHGGITVTPHGRIEKGSARDTEDGIEYTTEDGQRWFVSPAPGGGYGTPEPRN
jgi:hypothetical protein